MKALALVEAPDHVCCRYRIKAFEPALAASGVALAIESLAAGPVGRLLQFRRARSFDSVVLQRKLLPIWQVNALRRQARHLVFDFDDAVLYRDSYDPRGPLCRRRSTRFARIVRLADTVIAGNDFLADCALRAGARPDQIRVIPTCIATFRYQPSTHTRTEPGLDLVWIGSASTAQGLERQRPLWEGLGRQFPGLRLRVISNAFPRFDPLPVIDVRWSAETEAAEIAAADVGITWVPDDLWSRGKCGLKVLQYQASGLPVIANPVGVHTEMIQQGETGFLPESADEWTQAISRLMADANLRRTMGQQARASVEAGYSVAAWASTFVAALTGTRAARAAGVDTLRPNIRRLATRVPGPRGSGTQGPRLSRHRQPGRASASDQLDA
jgi:glycosyltransferase involved in cell wall biosynthesis